MARQYLHFDQDAQDEVILTTYRAQEASHHSHATNVERYTDMLKTLPAGPFRDRIAALLITEQAALEQHEAILNATAKQLPPKARADAAFGRIKAKGLLG